MIVIDWNFGCSEWMGFGGFAWKNQIFLLMAKNIMTRGWSSTLAEGTSTELTYLVSP